VNEIFVICPFPIWHVNHENSIGTPYLAQISKNYDFLLIFLGLFGMSALHSSRAIARTILFPTKFSTKIQFHDFIPKVLWGQTGFGQRRFISHYF
jgi:hypothetical protein